MAGFEVLEMEMGIRYWSRQNDPSQAVGTWTRRGGSGLDREHLGGRRADWLGWGVRCQSRRDGEVEDPGKVEVLD
jgi:hypothetical protein